MIAKVAILCVLVAAVSCSLINTGVSSGSRVQDGHGNYAFEYGIASAGAKRSRSEVGSGYAGPIKTSYSVADSHIAPAAPVFAAAAPYGLGLGHAGVVGLGGLGYGAGVIAGPGLLGHGLGGVGLLGAGKLI